MKIKFRLPDLTDPIKKHSFIMFAGAAVVAILFVMPAAIAVFSHPKFCNMCHSNQADVQSWERSSHSNVTCYSCHMHPSIPYLMYEKVYAGITGVYYEASGNYERPINATSHYSVELPAEICERCHNMKNRVITATKGMVMNHEVHAKKEIGCAVCHNRVAHSTMNNQKAGAVRYVVDERTKNHKYMDGISHEGCFRCHTKKETHLLEENHDWKGPTKCTACHSKDWDLPEGHTEGFRGTHGALAKSRGNNSCYKCHSKEEFCGECHEPSALN